MATSGNIEKKIAGNSYGGYYIGVDWKVNSQSTANNSSNVTATVYIRSTGNGFTINSSTSKSITVTINGTKYSGTNTIGISTNTKKNLLSKTIDVKHNSDGTKTCSFACSVQIGFTLSGTSLGTVSHSGNGTFNTINLNTAPTWTSDDTRMNDIRNHVIIPENWNAVTITSATATDKEQGGNIHYDLHRYINGNYSAQIKSGGSGLSVTDYIGSWGQGTRIKYRANVHDGQGLWANGDRWSWEYTKNTFTKASVTSVGSIGIGSTTVTFTSTGIRNSGAGNGYVNNEFGYRIESLTSGVNIYGSNTVIMTNNNNVNFELGIKNNGGNPTNPHWLDANELKAVFRNNNYTGDLRLRLVSWNSYDSSGAYEFSIPVDLRQNPPWTSIRYGSNNKINFNGADYYIPAHLPFYLEWDAVYDPVEGNACTYDVLYQIENEDWVHLGTTSSTNYTAYLGNTAIGNRKINKFRMIVKAKTRYGYYSDTGGSYITLWDYAPPIVNVNSVNRTSTNVTLSGTITINTTIPNVTTTSTHWRWVGGSNTNFSVTNSSTSTIKNFTITIPAAQDLTGTIHVASSDTARDLLDKIVSMAWGNTEVAIKGYMPVMSINKFGVGINTRLANNKYIFEVDGNTNIKGNLHINGNAVANSNHTHNNIVSRGNVTCETGANRPSVSGISMSQVYNNGYPTTYGNLITLKGVGDSQLLLGWAGTNGAHAPVYVRNKRDVGSANWSDWAQVYTSANKPSALDIGALPTSGGTMTGYIQLPNNGSSWIDGATKGNLRGYQQSPQAYHPIISQTTSSGHKISLGGLGDDFGFHVYDKNRTENGIDKYWRISLEGKDIYTNMRFTVQDNWLYTTGNNGWYNSTHAGGWFMQDSTWVRSYNDKNIYTANTLRCGTTETRYIKGNQGGSNANLDLLVYDGYSIYINTNASTGASLYMNRNWSGSSGTEPSFYNSKGNGWGFVGNSGQSFYRVYGSGGSVSDRNKKYEITKADIETQYENIKDLNIYNYRTISTITTTVEQLAEDYFKNNFLDLEGKYITNSIIIDENEYVELDENLSQDKIKELRIKEIIEKNPSFGECKREDLSLGCMVDEMPLETTFYDNEGGDGKAVDMYSYTTMIAGAVKHLIKKVEQLEKENEELKNKIEVLEVK